MSKVVGRIHETLKLVKFEGLSRYFIRSNTELKYLFLYLRNSLLIERVPVCSLTHS